MSRALAHHVRHLTLRLVEPGETEQGEPADSLDPMTCGCPFHRLLRGEELSEVGMQLFVPDPCLRAHMGALWRKHISLLEADDWQQAGEVAYEMSKCWNVVATLNFLRRIMAGSLGSELTS